MRAKKPGFMFFFNKKFSLPPVYPPPMGCSQMKIQIVSPQKGATLKCKPIKIA